METKNWMEIYEATRIINGMSYTSVLEGKYYDKLLRMMMNRSEKKERDSKIHMVAIAQ